MSAHNRSSITQRCLNSLRSAAEQIPGDRIRVFLTDDGCTDDTVARARESWSELEIIPGSGSLYWAAGMAAAEACAANWEPDFYLWLNDDVILREDSLVTLLGTATSSRATIAVGATSNPDDGLISYGGVKLHARHPQRCTTLAVSTQAQPVDTFHGNIVLIPRDVHDRVGRIDGAFSHGYADFDYGLRARRAGVSVLLSPGFAGECRRNPERLKFTGGLRGRWKFTQNPVHGLPWRCQVRYLRRHAGVEWPLYALWSVAHRFVNA